MGPRPDGGENPASTPTRASGKNKRRRAGRPAPAGARGETAPRPGARGPRRAPRPAAGPGPAPPDPAPAPLSSPRAPRRPPPRPQPPKVGGSGPGAWRRQGAGPARGGGRGSRRPARGPHPQPPPRSPPSLPAAPTLARPERRTHPGDAMSAARSRRCHRLRFLRAERLRRGGASRRPPAARPGRSRRRGSGRGRGCREGSSGPRRGSGGGRGRGGEGARGPPEKGYEWARSARGAAGYRRGAGCPWAWGQLSGLGAAGAPAARSRHPGRGGRPTSACSPDPPTCPGAPGAPSLGLAGRLLRCQTTRKPALGPRSSCGTLVKSTPPCDLSLSSVRKAFSLVQECKALLSLLSKTIALLFLTCCAVLCELLASLSLLPRKMCVKSHCEALRTVGTFIIIYIALLSNNNESGIPAVVFRSITCGYLTFSSCLSKMSFQK